IISSTSLINSSSSTTSSFSSSLFFDSSSNTILLNHSSTSFISESLASSLALTSGSSKSRISLPLNSPQLKNSSVDILSIPSLVYSFLLDTFPSCFFTNISSASLQLTDAYPLVGFGSYTSSQLFGFMISYSSGSLSS